MKTLIYFKLSWLVPLTLFLYDYLTLTAILNEKLYNLMSKNTAQKIKLSINHSFPFLFLMHPFQLTQCTLSLPPENIRKGGTERGIERVHLEQMG